MPQAQQSLIGDPVATFSRLKSVHISKTIFSHLPVPETSAVPETSSQAQLGVESGIEVAHVRRI
jgi:hypothetical protein